MSLFAVDLTPPEIDLFAEIVWRLRGNASGHDVREEVLPKVMQLLRADFGASYVWNACAGSFEKGISVNIDQALRAEYDRHLCHLDTITPQLHRMRGPLIIDQVIGRQRLEHSVLYQKFLRPCRMHHGINVFFSDGARDLGDLRIWRASKQKAFGARDSYLLQALASHFVFGLERAWHGAPQLTPREREVVMCLVEGSSDKEIARKLDISFTTVRTHLSQAMKKMGCHNRTMLAIEAAKRFS